MKTSRMLLTAVVLCLLHSFTAAAQDSQYDTLAHAVVTADKALMPRNTTQTGLTRLDASKFTRGFALFSSPDVIKTLQQLPGVSVGTELLSGFYVHGGIGSDNLFQLDNVPIYQVSHLAGLFSSFNTDMVDQVDFYKSGFPARYGGRMSSVVDVKTQDGDFNHLHGSFSIGLVDGRFNLNGPVGKSGKTSFNVGMRRSWLDVVTTPAMAIIIKHQNKVENDDPEQLYDYHTTSKARYAFWDANARLTHKFTEDNRLSLNFYMGRDELPIKVSEESTRRDDPRNHDTDSYSVSINWGNILASLDWQRRFSDQLALQTTAFYSGYRGLAYANVVEDYDYYDKDSQKVDNDYADIEYSNYSRVNDLGLRSDLFWKPASGHNLRTGVHLIRHAYDPSRDMHTLIRSPYDTLKTEFSISNHYSAFETALYAEDEIQIGKRFTLNAGLRYAAYFCTGKTYHRLEPRLAMKLDISDAVAFKLSYADMNQFNHLVSSTYLDLPGNMWMPSTAMVEPMRSRQIAGGFYLDLPRNWYANVEGWYKSMDNIHEYVGAATLFAPVDKWESMFSAGRGRSYGAELETGWSDARTDVSLAYTLSWSQRNFPDVYEWWYPDIYDNRHKITLMGSRRLTRKLEMYGSWNYHTGNRATVPTQEIDTDDRHESIYDSPNNLCLPAYHRLDLGFNFHRTTKRGNEAIWNLSIYNLYCRMNPIMAEISSHVEYADDEELFVKPVGTAYGVVPIIPSFSYTLKF